MNCRFVNDLMGMHCVDENYDSSENADDYDGKFGIWNYIKQTNANLNSQEGELMVKKLHMRIQL